MKRSLLALLALCAVSSTGFAQTYTYGEWLYTVNGNGEATLVGITPNGVLACKSEPTGFAVPEYLGVYPLKTIGPNAFSALIGEGNWEGISFTGVTRVEADAFKWVSVKNLEFWSETLSIEDAAFRSCYALQSISAANVTKIGAYAFSEGYSFRGFTDLNTGEQGPIPSTVTSIGARAFWDCDSLPLVVAIPSGVTSIQALTFASSAVQRCIIPDTVTSIDYNAFADMATGPTGKDGALLFKGCPPAGPFSLAGTIYRLSGATGWSNSFGGVPVKIFLETATAIGMSPALGGFKFSWRESGGLFPVNVERATSPGGPWTAVSPNNTNGEFTDLAPPSGSAFYRAKSAVP
ncbi:MAG: hypothetical protein RIQ71_1479 [Verrucomicrobiota bacterium]|jgi:hypothetical protein